MGQGGLEPPTPRLSSVCSDQLSYWPPAPARAPRTAQGQAGQVLGGRMRGRRPGPGPGFPGHEPGHDAASAATHQGIRREIMSWARTRHGHRNAAAGPIRDRAAAHQAGHARTPCHLKASALQNKARSQGRAIPEGMDAQPTTGRP